MVAGSAAEDPSLSSLCVWEDYAMVWNAADVSVQVWAIRCSNTVQIQKGVILIVTC